MPISPKGKNEKAVSKKENRAGKTEPAIALFKTETFLDVLFTKETKLLHPDLRQHENTHFRSRRKIGLVTWQKSLIDHGVIGMVVNS